MKKYSLLVISLLIITLSGFTVKVPKAVSDAFAKKFPAAMEIKWGKENANEYEADFKMSGNKMSANFLADGSWTETEATIAVNDLPAIVVATVKTKYPAHTIAGAGKIEKANGEILYETELKKGSKKMEVILNADGSIVK
ncbi:PepSY-like domain-containing protein [Ferruginibacter sp.]